MTSPIPTEGGPFEIGCTVQPRGGGYVVGELIEFNADATGALIRWNSGHEIWKALRNLEIVPPHTTGGEDGR